MKKYFILLVLLLIGFATAEVILDSPADEFVTATETQEYTCSANITNGQTILNQSLMNNQSGTFEIVNTTKTTSLIGGNGLIRYFKLDENNVGDGIIIDAMNNENATNQGTNNLSCLLNSCYNYSAGAGINMSHVIDSDESQTWGAWINSDSTSPNEQPVIAYEGSWASNTYSFQLQGDGNLKLHSSGVTVITTNGSPISRGTWHHVVVTSNSSGSAIYVDGVVNATSVNWMSNSNTVNNIWIGRRVTFNDYFNGRIDEVEIWNRSLTATDVANRYNSTGKRPSEFTYFTTSWEIPITVNHVWNCQTCDTEGNCTTADANYTNYLDSTAPVMNVISPDENTVIINNSDLILLNFSATDSNLDSCWYEYNNTNTSVPSCLTGIFNVTNITSIFNNNYVIAYANDTAGNLNSSTVNFRFDYPNFTIISPSTSLTSKTFIVNATISSTTDLDDCYYNITRGASTEVATTFINCSEFNDSVVVSSFADYVLNIWANTTGEISNQTSYSFSVNDPSEPAGGGGGGGGTVVIDAGTNWEMEAGGGQGSFDVTLILKTSQIREILFTNKGESQVLTLSCEDINNTGCKYVTFPQSQITLPQIEDIKTVGEFKMTAPETAKTGEYTFNIVATDGQGKTGRVSVFLTIKESGFFAKLTSRTEGGTHYLLIAIISFITSAIISSILLENYKPKRKFFKPLVIILISIVVTYFVILVF